MKENPELTARIAAKEKEINARPYYYIPETEINRNATGIKDGDIVCFVTTIKGLDISHVGCRSFHCAPGGVQQKAACAYGNTAVLRSRFCKYRSGAKGKQHCGAEQQAYNFSLWFHCLILFETVGSNCLQTQKGASRPRKTAGETRLVFLI